MQCPLCLDSPLDPTFVRGVEVDVCPRCRGMWLDRGEIDRFLAEPAGHGPFGRPEEPGARSTGPAPVERSTVVQQQENQQKKNQRQQGKKQKSKGKRLADLLDDILDL